MVAIIDYKTINRNKLFNLGGFGLIQTPDKSRRTMIKKKPITQVNWDKIVGNMPLATADANGLMSKQDKMVSPINIATSNYPILKIHTHATAWSRCSSIFWGSLEGHPFVLCIGSYLQDSKLLIESEWVLNPQRPDLRLYKKGNDVYLYISNTPGSTNNLMGISSTGVEVISRGTAPDDSYELV